jgi:TetR/AcrR family transcriptional repressor of nem operon
MSDQSETLRKELSEVMARRVTMFARCIEEGQTLGEITKVGSAEQLALFFISSLSGAFMSAKTVKTIDPIDTFIDLMFNHFLKA